MSYFPEMEWGTKWGWENLVDYGSKAMESPKKLHLTELVMADDGEIEAGSFNMSGNGNSSGVSGSDGGFHGSSGKSSVSASTNSSTKDGTQTPNFMFMGFEGSFNLSTNVKMRGTEVSRTSPAMEASIGSVEPVIGLKLGKRTYFENNFAGGNVKSTSLSVTPTESAVTQKKTKSSGKNANISRCQVEGCNVDLSMAKEYHQKHRVCGFHSKSPRVVIGGHERRFCQQCSRFHGLSEFDEKKRSCRRRLSDHNARRRKPPQETMQFSSTGLSSSFYGGRQQLTFLLNDSPFTTTHSLTPASSTWDPTCNSKFTLTKDYPFKCNNYGGTPEPLHMSGVRLPPVTNMNGNSFNGFLSSKSFQSEVLSPGSKGSLISSSHIDAAAPVHRRAFSLLSNNNSWGGSCAPESVPIQHHTIMQENDTSCITYQHPMMNAAIQEGVQLSFPDFWPPSTGHHSTRPSPRVQSLDTNTNFQEIQLLEMPMPEEADFYSNVLNLT